MKVIALENIIDIADFFKFLNKICNHNKEQIESRLEPLALEYAINHDCRVQIEENKLIFFPEEMLSIPDIFNL